MKNVLSTLSQAWLMSAVISSGAITGLLATVGFYLQIYWMIHK